MPTFRFASFIMTLWGLIDDENTQSYSWTECCYSWVLITILVLCVCTHNILYVLIQTVFIGQLTEIIIDSLFCWRTGCRILVTKFRTCERKRTILMKKLNQHNNYSSESTNYNKYRCGTCQTSCSLCSNSTDARFLGSLLCWWIL